MWPMLVGSIAGLGLGALNAQEQRAQKKDELMANAEAIRMSPWTGQKTSVQGYGSTPTTLGGALQGGLSGAMMGSQFSGAGAAPAAAATPDYNPAEKAFNGQAMGGEAGNPWDQMQKNRLMARQPTFMG